MHIMQILIFLINVLNWPANSEFVLLSIKEAVTLQAITDQFYELVLPNEFLNEKDWDSLDNPSTALILSIAIFGVVLLVLLILIILYCLFKPCAEKLGGIFRKIWLFLRARLFYNVWLRYMIEGNLSISYHTIFFLDKEMSFATTITTL